MIFDDDFSKICDEEKPFVQPWHGDSPHDDKMSYLDMASDVELLIKDVQKIEDRDRPINLLGHSMGGRTAMVTALNYPELINKLIVVDVSPDNGRTSEISGTISKYIMNMNQVNFNGLETKYRKASDARNHVATQLSKVVDDKGVLAFLMMNMVQDRQTKKHSWRSNIPAICSEISEISNFPYVKGQNFKNHTLFIGGRNSNYISLRHYGLINELFPNNEIEMVENAGHWVHADQPNEFVKLVTEFL